MKSFKDLDRQVVQEGRPSQRHPLEGHEYHKKSDEALIHIAKDAHKAAEAMKSHNTEAENKYRDQANDSATVRYFRKKNGMPEWYKKKYGHVKEDVVAEGENKEMKDSDPCWKGYQMVGMKDKGGKKVPNCVPTKEEVSQIDELSKDTLKSYMDKSSKDNLTSLMKPGMIAKKHAAKRFIGMMKAGEKLAKESNGANMPADIGTPAQLSLKATPKKLETPVYESRRMEIVREAMVDAKKKNAVKKDEKKVSTGGNDKFQQDPELSSNITKNA